MTNEVIKNKSKSNYYTEWLTKIPNPINGDTQNNILDWKFFFVFSEIWKVLRKICIYSLEFAILLHIGHRNLLKNLVLIEIYLNFLRASEYYSTNMNYSCNISHNMAFRLYLKRIDVRKVITQLFKNYTNGINTSASDEKLQSYLDS